MTAAHVMRLSFGAAQVDRGGLAEHDGRRTGLIAADNVGADVLVTDDLRVIVQEVDVAPGMVPMVMGVQDVSHGLVGDLTDTLHDFVVVLFELVVDDDDTLVGDARRHVTARSFDHVQAVGHLGDRQWRGLLPGNGRYCRGGDSDGRGKCDDKGLFLHGWCSSG